MLGTTALILAVLFIFTVTARWLYVFAGPAFTFLQESWALADDPVVQEARKSVVQVYIDSAAGPRGGQRRGSGFNIDSEGLIVTNRHLVEGASLLRVSFPERGVYVAKSWEISPYVDLAVIEIEAEDLPVVPLGSRPGVQGQDLLVIGNPLQFARIANKGELVGFSENPGREIPYLVIRAAIYPGSSGSPLFNERGEVVGVVFATLRNGDPSEVKGLAVDVREVKELLEELKQ